MDTTANSSSSARKPRGWPLILLVAFVTGLAAGLLALPISDWAMGWHHVSTMEGGRGCMALIIWGPLGFLVGCAVGVTVSLLIKRTGFFGYLIRQGISLALAALLVSAGGGLGYATADHPPLLNGRSLALEIEVQAPAKGRSIEELRAAECQVALVVSVSDRSYSDMRWAEATKANESIVVPAWAPLKSRNAGREITVGVKDENRQIFNVLLPASPGKIDDQWSAWVPPRERFDHSRPEPNDQYLVRYRVRYEEEYSPTPQPAWQPPPTESPTPEESPSAEPASSP